MPGKKEKAPGHPRGKMSAYGFFVKACRQQYVEKGLPINFGQFNRECSVKWLDTNIVQRTPYQAMADADVIRYNREMAAFRPPPTPGPYRGVSKKQKDAKQKAKKKAKDPNAPKRPLTPFLWFSRDEREKVKSANPDFKVGDVAKALGKMWQDLDEPAKQIYQTLYQRDKQRFQRESAAYQQNSSKDSKKISNPPPAPPPSPNHNFILGDDYDFK